MTLPLNFAANTLTFPLVWHSRLILENADEESIRNAIQQIFASLGLTAEEISHNQKSSGGKYMTWRISCTIPDYTMFHAAKTALATLPGFKMLL